LVNAHSQTRSGETEFCEASDYSHILPFGQIDLFFFPALCCGHAEKWISIQEKMIN